METLKIITQNAGDNTKTLLESISEECKKNEYDTIYILTAFASSTGFEALQKKLQRSLKKVLTYKICVGINNGVTDYKALKTIFENIPNNSDLYCYINENDKDFFHSKIYRLENSKNLNSLTYVCSNNMTLAGLSENIESYTCIHDTKFSYKNITKKINPKHISSIDDIKKLYNSGLLNKNFRKGVRAVDEKLDLDCDYFWFTTTKEKVNDGTRHIGIPHKRFYNIYGELTPNPEITLIKLLLNPKSSLIKDGHGKEIVFHIKNKTDCKASVYAKLTNKKVQNYRLRYSGSQNVWYKKNKKLKTLDTIFLNSLFLVHRISKYEYSAYIFQNEPWCLLQVINGSETSYCAGKKDKEKMFGVLNEIEYKSVINNKFLSEYLKVIE